MYFRIPFKSGCDSFPSFIQLNGQLLHAFMPIGGMSCRTTNRDTLNLLLFTLQQRLSGITPAIAVFEPDVQAAQSILKAFQQQTQRVTGALYPTFRIVHEAFPGAGNYVGHQFINFFYNICLFC